MVSLADNSKFVILSVFGSNICFFIIPYNFNKQSRVIAGNSYGEMDLVDLRMPAKSTDKTSLVHECKCLKRYKHFQGTIKCMQLVHAAEPASQPAWHKPKKSALPSQVGGLCVATCGLDRHVRVHHVETGQLVAKVYLKSRLNCLLYSRHEPVKQIKAKRAEELGDDEEDRLSSIHSEDLGTDDLWSDMETVVEEHHLLPGLDVTEKAKRKLSQRLQEVDQDEQDDTFKKPK